MEPNKFVIYLDDDDLGSFTNNLGYWTGKTYTHQGEIYLICETDINDQVKIYKSKKRAENAAEKLKRTHCVDAEVQALKRSRGMNYTKQYYKDIPLRLIKRNYKKMKAKRFLINDTNQNVWIPNKHLESDGTIKLGENLDYVFRKSKRQLEIALEGVEG